MAGTLRVHELRGDAHSRHKRQDNVGNEEENTLEEVFNMTQFVGVMRSNDKIDLVVIMDRSWGMGKRDFYLQQKKLVRSIINQYTILHPDYDHLAIVTFALDVEVPVDYVSPGQGTAITKAELFGDPWERVLYRIDPTISKVKPHNMSPHRLKIQFKLLEIPFLFGRSTEFLLTLTWQLCVKAVDQFMSFLGVASATVQKRTSVCGGSNFQTHRKPKTRRSSAKIKGMSVTQRVWQFKWLKGQFIVTRFRSL